ncbi:unnamed protein product [Prorocentrum cordatum]|uniref:Uncharacterized protein n=1 Tax=Prorocentrum cordatum TaxID=2364126 RepID=A0ABN9YIP5_9DINO|nr:unnamed protein product [Polarella glacialis]
MCAGNLRVLRMLLPGSQNIRAHAGARSLSGKADLQCYLLFSVALLVRKALFRNAVNATLLTSQIERLWEHHAQALRPPGFPDVHMPPTPPTRLLSVKRCRARLLPGRHRFIPPSTVARFTEGNEIWQTRCAYPSSYSDLRSNL